MDAAVLERAVEEAVTQAPAPTPVPDVAELRDRIRRLEQQRASEFTTRSRGC